ncbi:phosphatidylinositol-4-phosphate-5-kinase, putative [Bodo saltans]|uniref:Phosphatidylinositol-4-phosphate-5-kinase, putative n=1 Tax=Bodo saltans TaxID=75058 RepID=A0A0S4JKY5_BODSA|nr:phosphatidylinositol-4-phosphate-5-kinase, putative [Bodo saltans]|eukprot:CUG90828.1 phosphatidylinositol-4-phosphate-5-kinase, putative [Bodo saltans]
MSDVANQDLGASNSSITVWTDGTCKGWMSKFSMGKSFFGASNWKRRYFVLAALGESVGLGYYEDMRAEKLVGTVRLHSDTTRVIANPSTLVHKQATAAGQDICIIFINPEDKKEMMLLLRTESRDDHDRWIAALTFHFKIIEAA